MGIKNFRIDYIGVPPRQNEKSAMTTKEVKDYIYKSIEYFPEEFKGDIGFKTGRAVGLIEGFSVSGVITKEESSEILRGLFEDGIL